LRRIKMIMGIAAVLVGMLALNAGPAMADELDGFFTDEDFSGDDVFFVDEGTTLDELCSPGLSDGIFIPGCIFSDSIEEDINFDDEEVVFFLEEDADFDDFDFDFEDEDIFDDDHDNHDNEREVLKVIDRD
jgi:hypothetical protein